MRKSYHVFFLSVTAIISLVQSSLIASEELDEVSRACASIETILLPANPVAKPQAKLPAKPDESAIRLFVKGLRDLKENDMAVRARRTDVVAKDDAFVTKVINDLPDTSIGTIWSDTARERIKVDTERWVAYSANDVLGSLLERSMVSRFFSLAAKAAEERNDPKRAIEIRRTAVRYYVADPMDLAGVVTNLTRTASKRNTTVSALLGIEDADKAKEMNKQVDALVVAWNAGINLHAPAALQCDRAIKQLLQGNVSEDDLEDAIDKIESLWDEAAPNNCGTSWSSANFMYRLRSMVALKGTKEQLEMIDGRIDKLIENIDIQPQKRWMIEAKTTTPVMQDGSGVRIISDPNAPEVKGLPPQ